MMKVIVVALSALVLSGCASQPAPIPEPMVQAITAEQTCKQVGNVLTVVYNASVSKSEGRSTQQELDGALALADGMLDDVDVEPGSTFETIVDRLRAVNPADYPMPMISNGSTEWSDANEDLVHACDDAGTVLALNAWTGG